MSTVMYAYRVPNSQLWPFLDAVRAFYVEHDFLHKALRDLAQARDRSRAFDRARKLAAMSELYVTVQLCQDGDTWLLRVLEEGYFFQHHWEQQFAAYLTPVFYDDRTAIPPADAANAPVAEQLDALIAGKRYLLAVIVDRDELLGYFCNLPIPNTEDE